MTDLLFWIIFILITITFCVVLYNFFTAPRMQNYEDNSRDYSENVSVLIPARNEENNIEYCLDSICEQSYKKLEIIVLDDQSTDATSALVKKYSEKDSRIKLINGLSLPEGWLGKNWACHNLSLEASSQKLLFIDADVRLQKNAIIIALDKMKNSNANMLSVFPTQIIDSFGSSLITPIMNWILLTFLPLKKVLTSSNKSFVAANGQFILINKNDYLSIGGHENVKANVVEDMELARALKMQRKKVITLVGDTTVYCKMYPTFIEAFNGFSKNFYPGFNINIAPFVLMLLILFSLFFLPFYFVFWGIEYLYVLLMILGSRAILASISKQNITLNVILHPLQMIILLLVGLNSVIVTRKKKATWKGRTL